MIAFPFLRPGLCSVSFFQFVSSRSRWAGRGHNERYVPIMTSGAGRDNSLLNGQTEGRLHSSGRPRCGSSLLHLLQPLHVQRGVHTCWSYGCWLPSLPGSSSQVYFCAQPPRWQSSTVLCQLLVCTTALLEPELSIRAVCGAHNSFQTVPVGISNSQGESDY